MTDDRWPQSLVVASYKLQNKAEYNNIIIITYL